jgi:hypothetical protein
MSFWSQAWAWATGSSVSSRLAKTALIGYGVKLLSDNINESSQGKNATVDQGVRLQLSPDTENKIPVLYGTAYFAGDITDANLSADYKTMTYCLTLAETTGNRINGNSSTYQFNDVYLNNNRVIFNSDGVTVDYTVDRAGNQDLSYRGLVKIYFYANNNGIQPQGYSSTTPASSAVMPGWTNSTHPMTGLVYAIVQVTYNRDKGITGLPNCVFQVTNSMSLPGDVLNDYMRSTRYGAGIAAGDIDVDSLTALNSFATTGFTYTSVGGQLVNSVIDINGIVDANATVLDVMEEMAKATGSWLSYDTHRGKWRVIINQAGSAIAQLDDSNILGEISISGTSLTQLSNVADVKYLNNDILDKPDFVKITLPNDELFANEPRSALQLTLPFTNKQVVALKIGAQLLKQARVDKVITFTTDYSYINLTAGDLISITSSVYGFTNKQFRIVTAEESQGDSGEIQINFTALEYDADVYAFAVQEFEVETNDGILTIGSIGKPGVPQVSKIEEDSRPRIFVESLSPSGVVEGMEFWLSNDVSSPESTRVYRLIATPRPGDLGLYAEDTAVSIEYDSLNSSDFVVKTRGFNSQIFGPFSDPSGFVEFRPTQVTQGIDANTTTTGLLTGLALLDLIGKLDGLFDGDDSKSLFDKIFDIFKEETGVDILGDAEEGTLVVASEVGIAKDGTLVTNNVSSINFTGDGVSDISVSDNNVTVTIGNDAAIESTDIEPGQTLAWDGEKFVAANPCCPVEYSSTTSTIEEYPKFLRIIKKYPDDRRDYINSSNKLDRAPINGSYFLSFGADTPFYGPLTKGTGNAYLYKSDGTLIQTLSASALTIYNNVVEFPFSPREASTDYYILVDRGIVKYCDAVSPELVGPVIKELGPLISGVYFNQEKGFVSGATWNFNTPRLEVSPYIINNNVPLTPIQSSVAPLSVGFFKEFKQVKKVPVKDNTVYPPKITEEEVEIEFSNVKNFIAQNIYPRIERILPDLDENTTNPPANTIEINFSENVNKGSGQLFVINTETKALLKTFEAYTGTVNGKSIRYSTPGFQFDPAIHTVLPDKKIAFRKFTESKQSNLSICPNATLKITFNNEVKVGTGQIQIRLVIDDSVVGTIDASTGIVDSNDPTSIYYGNVENKVVMDQEHYITASAGIATSDVIKDCYHLSPSEAIIKENNFKFKVNELKLINFSVTFPQGGIDSSKQRVSLQSEIGLIFNKAMFFGNGTISIFESNGTLHQTMTVTNNFEFNKINELFWISGTTVFINATKDFKPNTTYYVQVSAGALIDECGMSWGGISNTTTVSFKTENGPVATLGVNP